MDTIDNISPLPAVSNQTRQLLVDISFLVKYGESNDMGPERVIKHILYEWLINPPHGFRVEPVYATPRQEYRYARRFTVLFLNGSKSFLEENPVEYQAGDIFFSLGSTPQVVVAHQHFYQTLHHNNIKVWFLLHDLLLISMPQYFNHDTCQSFLNWINIVVRLADGAICISRTVANELDIWMKQYAAKRLQTFSIRWFHLGSDFNKQSFVNAGSMKKTFKNPLKCLRNERSMTMVLNNRLNRDSNSQTCQTKRVRFLMVSTIEPRKGYAQTLAAFEQLWAEDFDVELIIAGRKGWMVRALVKKIRRHPERNRRLFWLDHVSDRDLDKLYASSTCMIAASEGEGFGLPLIEAAQHRLPILARDLFVFREIAGHHVHYFRGLDKESLVLSIREWLTLYIKQQHPTTDNMPYLTWSESATLLSNVLIRGE